MLAEQRAEAILTELAQRRAVSVTDLCQVTGASEATIRRDLNTLAAQGKVKAAWVWNVSQAAFRFSALPPPKQYTG